MRARDYLVVLGEEDEVWKVAKEEISLPAIVKKRRDALL